MTFARSADGGRNWTKPVHVDKRLAWSDKPIVAVSDDGKDVYIAFNGPSNGDAYVAVSHDRGDHFGQPVPAEVNKRYHFAGGGFVAADGTVAFGQTSYNQDSSGSVRVLATTSIDGGRTWRNVRVDRMAKQPDCVSKGCPKDFYGPQAAMAGDSSGRLQILYNGASRRNGNQRVYARRSPDGGLSWSARKRISPKHADAAFPAAIGGDAGDFQVWYMDDRGGSNDRWNVWFRRSTNGGRDWSRSLRISDASRGTAYIRPDGFLQPYGDYGELAIIQDDQTFAVWGRESATRVLGAPGTTEPGRHSQRLRRRLPSRRRAAVQRGLDLRDRLLVVPEVDGAHAKPLSGVHVHLDVVDEKAVGRPDAVAQPLDRELVDLGLRLSHADEPGIDDHLEDLINRDHRAPVRLPLAHVVGEQGHPVAARTRRAHHPDHRLVDVERLEVDVGEAVELRLMAQVDCELASKCRRGTRFR